jgi:hypothetical protein
VVKALPALTALWRRRVNSENFFIREMCSAPNTRTSRATRRWGSRIALRGVYSRPILINLRSTAHRLLLFLSVFSVSSALKIR